MTYLKKGTAAGLKIVQDHVLWAGGYGRSAFKDKTFTLDFLYTGSQAPEEFRPDRVQTLAISQKKATDIPSRFTQKDFDFNHRMTDEEHELVLRKAISIHEEQDCKVIP